LRAAWHTPVRSANRLTRSADGPILGCPRVRVKKALDWLAEKRCLGEPFALAPDMLLKQRRPQLRQLLGQSSSARRKARILVLSPLSSKPRSIGE
jgi:hypothetical protein